MKIMVKSVKEQINDLIAIKESCSYIHGCFEKNIIHFDGTHLIFNDSVIELTEDERDRYSGFISSDDMNVLKKRYPGAEGYDGDMESMNFGANK